MTQYIPPNVNVNGLYSGNCYAFEASGGYIVQQGIHDILLQTPDLLQKYDVTDAIQVKFSARTLNKKLGVLKDASNVNVMQAWFNIATEKHYRDSIKVCACDFIDGINYDSIISVGKLSSLYNDFRKCVSSYFGSVGGFMSLFSNAEPFTVTGVNNNIFDASAMVQVLNSSQFNMQGSFISDLSGNITIGDINNLLEWVVDSNVFQNRDPAVNNWGVIDGFVAGDLVFIPQGFTISLSINIQPETLLPINNVGPSYLDKIANKLNWTRGYVTRKTTYSTTNITQTTTVPILLVLQNATVENYLNYGFTWKLVSTINNSESNKWLSISLSSDGRYQSAIDEDGNIHISSDYGETWIIPQNIGNSTSNNIAISFTGIYQTVSNGTSIYVSDDYGQTWLPTFNNGNSKIFVTISLNGQYQTVVSCGDTVYISNDFGQTWKPIDPTSDLFYSVEAFPTAGVASSYTGQYQTIVTENIYITSDYGETWTDVSTPNNLDDRNWISVSMASNGKYQTAIENGGDIYISNDYGVTWLYVDSPDVLNKTWESISLSATGQYQTALEQNGYIYISNDYGNTWAKVTDPIVGEKTWQSISVSSDGLYQTAISYGGQVYMSTVLTNIVTTGGVSCICD